MSPDEKLHQESQVNLDAWYQKSEPWNAGFISMMRVNAARTPDMPAPGKAMLPEQETFRIGQSANMAFAPREIAHVEMKDGKMDLQLFSLGIWGPHGAMPLQMTELAYTRAEVHDHTMTDFVDLFHHRALSHLYRAWFVSQDTSSLDRRHDEKFSFYVASLAGLDLKELGHSALPVHAQLASSAHLIREARNPEGLVGALQYYFEVPVSMVEYAQQWIFLDKDDQTQLGDSSSAMLLGDGAILGNTVLDRQHKFELILGPLSLKQYLRFSPSGQDLPVLREWVRNFVGFEYAWEVQLLLAANEVPTASLMGESQLGYTSWLARNDTSADVSGMSFEPEMHRY
ncbi:type VI secretion system baseplate subunit TssG [Yersinia hibernica]|uniref:Type VI secretion system baseplate subunit TssG n=1 Tax=Yersinia hibernica TaxID=2339259 RepID=A0ABX5R3J4_9GAMM|nr:type VI secretion system baseplate subunit TssG [Yersinia hibernica]QAX80032.1 type VI secretion system baseplate subunit TssG [Yersinia hibernica]